MELKENEEEKDGVVVFFTWRRCREDRRGVAERNDAAVKREEKMPGAWEDDDADGRNGLSDQRQYRRERQEMATRKAATPMKRRMARVREVAWKHRPRWRRRMVRTAAGGSDHDREDGKDGGQE